MLIIRNAKVLTMAGRDYERGDILVENGKIAAVGEGLSAPAGVQEFQAEGLWALPGFIDAHCHLGMWEDGMGFEGEDGNEATDPVTPHLRAIDAINPCDPCFREAREAGITTACTGPGSANVLGGQFAAVKTYGDRIDDMIVKAPLALKAAFGENPKRVYHDQKKSPSTRMATAAELRAWLLEHLEDHYALYGEYTGVRTARKHLGWYARALPGGAATAAAFRERINALESCEAQLQCVKDHFDRPQEDWKLAA